jgi:hypothetical protein
MPLRTTRSQVTFSAPFSLAEIDEIQPPGTYDVDTEEEIVEGNERTVYIRVATLIHLRTEFTTRTVTVNPKGLEAALAKDGQA